MTPTQQPPQPTPATVSDPNDMNDIEFLGWAEYWLETQGPVGVTAERRLLATARAYHALRVELARVTALREAVAHVLVCHAAVVAAATPKRGGPDPMFVDVSTEQARLDDAVDSLVVVAQASERAAGSGEGGE